MAKPISVGDEVFYLNGKTKVRGYVVSVGKDSALIGNGEKEMKVGLKRLTKARGRKVF